MDKNARRNVHTYTSEKQATEDKLKLLQNENALQEQEIIRLRQELQNAEKKLIAQDIAVSLIFVARLHSENSLLKFTKFI